MSAGKCVRIISGQILFATAEAFHSAFDFREELKKVVIDVHMARFWGMAGVNCLDRVVLKFRQHGMSVGIIGMNEASATLVDKPAAHAKSDAEFSSAH
jgi:sulfate permease, SulP family